MSSPYLERPQNIICLLPWAALGPPWGRWAAVGAHEDPWDHSQNLGAGRSQLVPSSFSARSQLVPNSFADHSQHCCQLCPRSLKLGAARSQFVPSSFPALLPALRSSTRFCVSTPCLRPTTRVPYRVGQKKATVFKIMQIGSQTSVPQIQG